MRQPLIADQVADFCGVNLPGFDLTAHIHRRQGLGQVDQGARALALASARTEVNGPFEQQDEGFLIAQTGDEVGPTHANRGNRRIQPKGFARFFGIVARNMAQGAFTQLQTHCHRLGTIDVDFEFTAFAQADMRTIDKFEMSHGTIAGDDPIPFVEFIGSLQHLALACRRVAQHLAGDQSHLGDGHRRRPRPGRAAKHSETKRQPTQKMRARQKGSHKHHLEPGPDPL